MVLDTLKQVGNQFGGFLNRSTIGNIQRTGLSLGRGFNGTIGSISSTFKFSNLRSMAQSFGAREVMDSEIMQEQLKIMSKSAQRLSSFNANTFSGIYKTYSSNPRKLTEVVNEIIQIYIKDVTAFHEAYSKFMQALNNSLTFLDKLDNELMSSILSFLIQAKQLAEQGKFNLPPGSVDMIKNQIHEFTTKQKNKLDRYASEDRSEYNKVITNTVGRTIKTMTGISWVAFKSKRIIDKISDNQLQIILKDIAELERQIEAKKLEVNFFPMIQEYLGGVDSCEVLAKDFREDMKLLFDTVEKDYILVRQSIAEFITILGNEEKSSELKGMINGIENLVDSIKNELSTDAKDIEKLIEDLARLQLEAPKLLDNIKELSQGMLNRLKNAETANKVLKEYSTRR